MEARARPIPHLILDGAFNAELVRAAGEAWPAQDSPCWFRYDSGVERKSTCHQWEFIPEPCAKLLGQLATFSVRRWFGVESAIPDLSLYGAGLHSMQCGDRLGMHLDADRHKLTGLARSLNAVLFVGQWRSEWGGELELGTGVPPLKVTPAFNRLVLFSPDCFHGIPEPLACPPGVQRKSLALYFWGESARPGERPRAIFYDHSEKELVR